MAILNRLWSYRFKGHSSVTLAGNLAWALSCFYFLQKLSMFASERFWLPAFLFGFALFISFPRPSYLFFEVKHLIFKDGIAEPIDFGGLIVFGLLSVVGFLVQILVNIMIANQVSADRGTVLVALAFLASLGACLGLTDLYQLDIFFPKVVLEHLIQVVKNSKLLLLLLSYTLILSVITIWLS